MNKLLARVTLKLQNHQQDYKKNIKRDKERDERDKIHKNIVFQQQIHELTISTAIITRLYRLQVIIIFNTLRLIM